MPEDGIDVALQTFTGENANPSSDDRRDFPGREIGSCRHCGAPVLKDDKREVLGHREPSCRAFFANATEALSYAHAVHANYSAQPAVLQ